MFPHKLGGGPFCVYSLNWRKPDRKIGPCEHSFPRANTLEKALMRVLARYLCAGN